MSLVCDLSGQLQVFHLPVHAIYSSRPLFRLPSELSNHFVGQRLQTQCHSAEPERRNGGTALCNVHCMAATRLNASRQFLGPDQDLSESTEFSGNDRAAPPLP